jgi:cobalt-zinc-cadmium resistance protein CzcA
MIRYLLTASLQQRIATVFGAGAIILLGIWAYSQLKIEAYPDVSDTEVAVITKFEGRAAEEVEQLVTIPLERALNGVPKVIARRSKTIFGLSVIRMTFEEGVDDYFARSQVLQKLSDADLPDGIQPELGPLSTPVGEIVRYVIEGNEKFSVMELRTLQDWTVVPRILQVPGVADVANFGGLVRQFHILTSPEQLQRYNLTLQNVIDAVQANNLNTGGRVLERGGQALAIRGIGSIRKLEDITNIVLTAQNGVPVFVKDVASVEVEPLPPAGVLGYALVEDSTNVSNGIQGNILMRRGENPSEVAAKIKAKIADLNENVLPDGVRLRVTYDRTELVNYTLETVSHTVFEGISIVLIVLIFFVGSLRSALVIATTIPISLLFAFILMKFTGVPANLLSLGAVDFGIIVDGAVVMGEGIMRRLSHASPEERGRGVLWVITSAAQEVGTEIFFAVTIIVMAYIPLFTFQRVEGKLFSPMAFTFAYAVFGSMLLALTLIPVLMSFIYRKAFAADESKGEKPMKIEAHNPVFAWMQRVYESLLHTLALKRPVLSSLVGIGLVVATLVAASKLGTEFLPELDEGSFNIRTYFPSGIALNEGSKYAPIIKQVIASHPQVKFVITQLGRNDDGTDPYGPNRMETLVGLKDYAGWASDTSKQELLLTVKRQLERAVPGALFSFSQPILDNVTEAVTGSVADLAVMISGNDLAFMRQKADTILQIIKKIPGASEFGIEQEGNQDQLSVAVNREAAARYGVNVSDVQKMVEAAIGGKTISTLYENDARGAREFDIVIRYTPQSRSSFEAIEKLLVTAPNGARIPLQELATVRFVEGVTIIQRLDGKRQISVRTNIRGRDQGSFVAEAQTKVAAAITLPKGYDLDWGGQFENLTRARNRLAVVVPLTILLIYLALLLLYRDLTHAAVALMAVPFALVGGVIALFARGYNFNVSAGVGFVSLFGVAVMSGVLLVSRINHLREDGGLSIEEATLVGSVMQFRPRMMTMMVALLGLIPAARASGIGSDIQRPLATVIIGGLLTALLLGLFVMPSLYLVIERWRDRRMNPASAQQASEASPPEASSEAGSAE